MDITNTKSIENNKRQGKYNVIVLISTFNRPKLLVKRALKSIAKQSFLPERVVIVNDGVEFEPDVRAEIISAVSHIPTIISNNKFSKGAAGSWNTGIDLIKQMGGNYYVAILDDDDWWEPSHLKTCYGKALTTDADAVISGLRLWMNGQLVHRPLLTSLSESDFLIGNPGWQGSNTFVKLDKLVAIGGFLDGMPSLNDRYLAIRLLELPEFNAAFTQEWTANWYCSTSPGSLSSPGSIEKCAGLQIFWKIFNRRMNEKQKLAFFQRAERLFNIHKSDILLPHFISEQLVNG